MKKPFLRKTASQNEVKTGMEAEPARDELALTLPISAITVKQNPRTDLGDLNELKASIADKNILNPLLVMKTVTGWELLGGHRRLECAKQLDWLEVPCRVVNTSDPEVIKVLDNILHESLSPQDECLAIKRLLPFFQSKSALARALSKNPSYVTRAIKAADLIETGLCAGAKLTKTALMELADASDPVAALSAAVDGKKESIRKAREAVNSTIDPKPSGPQVNARSSGNHFEFIERKGGKAFYIRINFDFEKTTASTKAEIIGLLEELLQRLRG